MASHQPEAGGQPEASDPPDVSDDVRDALLADLMAGAAFRQLSPTHRRQYLQ